MKRGAPRCGRSRRGCRGRPRGSLRGVLFAWFLVAIVATALTVGLVFRAAGGDRWEHGMHRVERFFAGRFAAVWDRPGARRELLDAAQRDLGVGVALYDRRGRVEPMRGERCPHTHRVEVPPHGFLRLCPPPPPPIAGKMILALLAAVVVLAGLSGALARRLSRPLRHLRRVAEAIGEGDLDARVRFRGKPRGEAAVLGQTLNRMADRIEAQIRDQKELLAGVSHELRTPLGHVRLLLELAREGQLDDAAIDELEREVVEMDRLVGELLARSRLEFETLDARDLDLVDLAARALTRLDLPAERLDAPAPVRAVGDPTLLGRALANLLENAERHGEGLARLGVRSAGDEVVFEVDDHGAGFGEEAFDPFVREGSGRHPSLGLGLALVRRIAHAHGGEVSVRRLSGGARGARVELRVAARAVGVGAAPGPLAPPPERA